MLLAVVVHYVDGSQMIVCVSELISDDEDFASNGGSGESDSSYNLCAYGNCSCNSLDHALANHSSNILINITTDVMLSLLIERSDLHNVSIIGHNNPTVKCINDGGIHITFCHNCSIKGVTWHGCGSKTKAGLTLNNSSNIAIQNCSFQHSLGRAVILSEVSGEISIRYCNFVNNNQYRRRHHGTAIHCSSKLNASYVIGSSHFVLNIRNCSFSRNKRAESVIYIENSIQRGNMHLYDSIFHDNKGVSIFLVNQKLCLHGNVFFENNKARDGAGINIRNHSTVVFGENSDVAFIQNSAKRRGGAIFVKQYSNILFDQNANIKFSGNSAAEYGSAICSLKNSRITFIGKSNVTFNRNQPIQYRRRYAFLRGTIYLGITAYISFQGHATTIFSNNEAYHGGAIYSSNVSFRENSLTLFSNNTAHWSAGAVYSPYNGYISFEGNSTTRFSNNNAVHRGGAIQSRNVAFGENSFTSFSNNVAQWGAVVYSSHSGYISFEGNSTTFFSNNSAAHTGGAITSYSNTHIYFKANSTTVFSSNIAVKYGAALSASYSSDITFDDNSTIKFISNKATNGTIVYSAAKSKIMAKGHSSIVFNGLSAKWCNNTCLPYPGQTDVVAIDGNGLVRCTYSNQGFTCESRQCYCNEFKADFKNNSVITITGTVIISSAVSVKHLHNISIIGHNSPSIYCINGSGLIIMYSRSITVEGITWVGCGNNIKKRTNSALHFHSSLNVTIQDCLFQYSKGPAIALLEVSEVNINQCEFVNNSNHGVHIKDRVSAQNNKINICDSTFFHNQGVALRVIKQQIHLNGKIIFQNNVASNGPGMYIGDRSDVIFGANSNVMFSENIAGNQGGAIYVTDDSTVLFDKNSKVAFDNNMATNGIIFSETNSNLTFKSTCEVIFSNNSVKERGAAIHSKDNSRVIFKGNAKVKFANNIVSSHSESRQFGGTIFSHNYSSISFERNSITIFSHNTASFGAAIFLFYKSTLKFKDQSRIIFNNNTAYNGGAIALRDNCTASIKQLSNLVFTNNVASHCGGALHVSHHCQFLFTDNSVTLFANNRAEKYGGAVCSNLSSSMNFEKRTTIVFSSNTASFGESLYSMENSVINPMTPNMIINNNSILRWPHGGQLTNKINDIIIDADGVVSCSDHKEYYICQHNKCFCKMLQDIPSDAVVTIAENITLSSTIQLTKLVNVSLIGYNNSSIQCKNDGGLQFTSCSNVAIVNITWNAFNSKKNMFNNTTPQIRFNGSSNITIDNCTFQQSVGQAIVLSEVSGDVDIKHCKFVDNYNVHPHRLHGTAIHYSSNCTKSLNDRLMISDCYFSGNSGIVSLILLENLHNNSWCESVVLQDSKFNNNKGICIYLSNQNLYIKGNVQFEYSKADNGAAIFINYHSNVTFDKASNTSFTHNTAVTSGGAIYISNWSSVVFKSNAYAIFAGNKAMISGGSIYSFNNSGIIMQENSAVQFLHSNAEYGGTLYAENYSFIITKGRSKVTINNNKATYGGVIFITQNSNMAITEYSEIELLNNKAKRDGGCVYSDSNSTIMFSGNSTAKIYRSKAKHGGAIYSCNNSGIIIDENSKIQFKHNSATLGGTLYTEKSSFIIAKGKSTVSFTNSMAINGGASLHHRQL